MSFPPPFRTPKGKQGSPKDGGNAPKACVFCTVVILFKLFLDCYSVQSAIFNQVCNLIKDAIIKV